MLFIQRRPLPPLDRWIECLWLCRSEPRPRALERVLPSGGSQLILNLAEDETRIYRTRPAEAGSRTQLGRVASGFSRKAASGLICERSPGSVLTGMSTRFHLIDTDEQAYAAGVVFRAGGTVPFAAPPAYELSDAEVALDCLWGREFSGLTPTAYEAHRTTFQNHVTFLQSPEG
jgi:hypothetical protein